MSTLADRVLQIRADIASAERQWGHTVKLIAVTKSRTAEEMAPLAEAGVWDIGENRVHEIILKQPLIAPDFRVHMIGRLQSNKVKYIIDRVCQIQSVDRLSLAEEIDLCARRLNTRMSVTVQVSPAGEPQKGGVPLEEAAGFIKRLSLMDGLAVRGIMAVMPLTQDEAFLDRLFGRVRTLYDRLGSDNIPGVCMTELSMGMSGDYRLALKNGANVIRIGTAIFGSGR
ncbi:MAG: YggS family pyridoxal phosphate-dependent enzyme [Clostridia bacterium]|nr:YggS family pyridoxal phosphate-dependent enzyme [Clostridia bacterium]